MTDEPIPMEFIGERACYQPAPHYAHNWSVFNNLDGKINAYRCHGVAMTNTLSSIIRKSCDLKVPHTLHIWEVPFLDGQVRYFCHGITPTEHEFLDLSTSVYGEDF